MKKFFLFASAAVLFATSCSDDLGVKGNQGVQESKAQLVASFDMGANGETRTSMVDNPNSPSKKSYAWSKGDALGVFAVDGNYTTNAMFSYVEGTAGDFVGDFQSLDGDTYWGYYPYNQGAVIQAGDVLDLYINPYQNYNHEAVNGVEWSWQNPLSGSFAPGAAPAVAYGTANSAGQLLMTFKAVASYFVIPMTTYEDVTVTKVELQVINGSNQNPMYLAGKVPVELSNLTQGYNPVVSVGSLGENLPEAEQTTLTLNCGKGVQLSAGEGTNFWFVVPAELPLSGSTVKVSVYSEENGDEAVEFTKTLAEGAGLTAQNQIYRILAQNNNPWVYNTDPTVAYIQTPEQFLEWAYLVTNGTSAIEEWADMQANNYQTTLSDFVNLVNFASGKSASDLISNANNVTGIVESVKNALVVNNLTFSQTSVSNATGLTSTSIVPNYLKGVYQDYIVEGTIPSIGGQNAKTLLTGVTPQTTVSGLSIAGPGMFVGDQYSVINVSNLTLDNVKVTFPQTATANKAYYLLGLPSYTNFSNVTVTSSEVNGPNANAVKCIFENVYTNYYTANNQTAVVGVVNDSEATVPYFAYNLNINTSSFNFTKATFSIEDFVNVAITPNTESEWNGYGALLTVADGEENAAAVLAKVVNNGIPYSIVDATTSYWTGTVPTDDGVAYMQSINKGTAELLAATVQGASGATFTLTMNLDLMGNYSVNGKDYLSHWYATNPIVTINGGNKTISNVYIDGTATGKKPATAVTNAFMTLFGGASTVKNLTVNDVEINNSVTGVTGYVGAISAEPLGASTLSVTGVTVNGNFAGGIGGLYHFINGNTVVTVGTDGKTATPALTGMTVSDVEFNAGEKAMGGELAGTFMYTAIGNQTLTNPATGLTSPFGVYLLYVETPANPNINYTTTYKGFNFNWPELTMTPTGPNGNPQDQYAYFVNNGSQTFVYKYNAANTVKKYQYFNLNQ